MTLQQLQYIVALDTHRHFVKAAESCYVAQPTLTLQVKKLEDQISAKIFDRTKQPLEPTALGELFIIKARAILNEYEELKALVNEEKDQMEGEFKIGIIPTLTPNLLPLFIDDFLKKHPKTKLIIEELQSEDIIKKINEKQLDLGILATPLSETWIREIPLFYEPFLVYADVNDPILKKNKVDFNDLKPDKLWLLSQGHCFRNQTLKICQFNEIVSSRNISMESGSIETLKKMVQKISGYTLIPELAFDKNTDTPNIIRFNAPEPVREISLITHKNFIREKLITELRKSIIENTPNSFKKNERFITVKWR